MVRLALSSTPCPVVLLPTGAAGSPVLLTVAPSSGRPPGEGSTEGLGAAPSRHQANAAKDDTPPVPDASVRSKLRSYSKADQILLAIVLPRGRLSKALAIHGMNVAYCTATHTPHSRGVYACQTDGRCDDLTYPFRWLQCHIRSP